jgi:DNA helicase II / ATP-dependent DNA helicase PcrA
MSKQLTPAQQAVVDHNQGPALVFAAAGSGKTTTMVCRIERLVQEEVFPAGRILATSFNRAAADAIEQSLRRRKIKEVQVKTLHSLGYGFVSDACRLGLFQADLERSRKGFENLDRQLLNRTLVEARQQRVSFADQLNRLDFDDFLDYVARCKGNLAYADLAAAQLPKPAQKIASQAQAPAENGWYLALYRLYESVRRQLGWITYDDMLMTGWEMIMRHPQILQQRQSQIQCLLVDEFQDVNLAQVEIVDRLSQPHRNLMVIGDDDQTIYEWRGAAARFILNFQERYGAKTYFLEENFRCTASQVALANAVIHHNRERSPKQLKLTRGFHGQTTLSHHPDGRAMGEAIAGQIAALGKEGKKPGDVAILVRLFAQTAPIEAALMQAHIPYRVAGDLPFHQRAEVVALLAYLRLAQMEAQLLSGAPLRKEQHEIFRQAWESVANRPLRYIARSLMDSCTEEVLQGRQPLSGVLRTVAQGAPDGVRERMIQLAADLHWLAGRASGSPPAHPLLQELEHRLGYAEALVKESGGEALGHSRAALVHAFVGLAEGRGTLEAFVSFHQSLASAQGSKGPAVTVTTIFRAKGLEWPVVIAPGCNNGWLPYERGSSVEEERRLLYVAITRAQEELSLHALQSHPLSPFLVEAAAEEVLQRVGHLRQLLAVDSSQWQEQQALALAVDAKRFGFSEYIANWWPDPRRRVVAATLVAVLEQAQRTRTLTRLGLDSQDLLFWRKAAAGATATVSPSPGRVPTRPQRSQPIRWSRTRRNSQAFLASVAGFFKALRRLMEPTKLQTAKKRKERDGREP